MTVTAEVLVSPAEPVAPIVVPPDLFDVPLADTRVAYRTLKEPAKKKKKSPPPKNMTPEEAEAAGTLPFEQGFTLADLMAEADALGPCEFVIEYELVKAPELGSVEWALCWLHHARLADWSASHEVRAPDGKVIVPASQKAEARLEELFALADKYGVRTALGLPEFDPDCEDDPLDDQVYCVDPWLPPPRDKARDAMMDALTGESDGAKLAALYEFARLGHGGDVQAALKAMEAEDFHDGAATLREAHTAHQRKALLASPVSTTLRDLLRREVQDVPWIIEDTAAPGAMLLVGRPKGGKSILSTDMVFAASSGGTFLGKQARQCGVLWIAAEDDEDQLARRLQKRRVVDIPDAVTVITGPQLEEQRKKWTTGGALHEYIDSYLATHRSTGLVIVDTQATAEAKWTGDSAADLELRRSKSVVKAAYAGARVYQDIGLKHGVCIVLVHHSRKRNGKDVSDYHELINMPMTVVAGVTSSVVVADLPGADPHDPKPERVMAVRGRHARDRTDLIELTENLTFTLKGDYFEIKQTEAQVEIMETIEALLEEQEQTSTAEIAKALGKNRSTVKNLMHQMKTSNKTVWKGRVLEIKVGKGGGIRWKK
jgi:hypothetical protein